MTLEVSSCVVRNMLALLRRLYPWSIIGVLLRPALSWAAADEVEPAPAPVPPAASMSLPSPAASGSATPGQGHPALQWTVRAALVGATHGWLGDLAPGAGMMFMHEPGPDGARDSIYIPRVSPGLGFRVGAGAIDRRLGTNVAVSAAISYERMMHNTSFPIYGTLTDPGPTWEGRHAATVHVIDLEFRVLLDRWHAKPYIAFSPGWTRLDLPGMGASSAPRQGVHTAGLDASMSGWCVGASAGLLYELLPNLVANGQVGYRWSAYTTSSVGDTSAATSRFHIGLGVELWF